jgi:hypothetical protein
MDGSVIATMVMSSEDMNTAIPTAATAGQTVRCTARI